MELISIITPTYNRAHLLPRMIQSVIGQCYKNWELLVMDDGSTDNTEDIINDFHDSRIKFIKGENTGASQKRNDGVNLASGKYIIFLDSDDEVSVNWLKEMSEPIKDDRNYVVTCGYKKVDHTGEIVDITYPEKLGGFFGNLKINFLSGSLLYKKDLFLEAGGYDTALSSGQHTELFLRLIPLFSKYVTEMKVIDKTLLTIHLHQGERIRNNYEGIYFGCTQTLEKHKAKFMNHPEMHFNYVSIASVMGLRTGRFSEARKYLKNAIEIKPLEVKSYIRFIISYFPFLARRIYPNKK